MFGGWVKMILTGTSPIASDVLDYLKVIFCCQIIEGWGSTESFGASTITAFNESFSGHVGGPTPNVEIKVIDIPEMGYLHTNSPNP